MVACFKSNIFYVDWIIVIPKYGILNSYHYLIRTSELFLSSYVEIYSALLCDGQQKLFSQPNCNIVPISRLLPSFSLTPASEPLLTTLLFTSVRSTFRLFLWEMSHSACLSVHDYVNVLQVHPWCNNWLDFHLLLFLFLILSLHSIYWYLRSTDWSRVVANIFSRFSSLKLYYVFNNLCLYL